MTVTFLDLGGQLDPPVSDVTFLDQGGQLDPPVSDVTFLDQGGQLESWPNDPNLDLAGRRPALA